MTHRVVFLTVATKATPGTALASAEVDINGRIFHVVAQNTGIEVDDFTDIKQITTKDNYSNGQGAVDVQANGNIVVVVFQDFGYINFIVNPDGTLTRRGTFNTPVIRRIAFDPNNRDVVYAAGNGITAINNANLDNPSVLNSTNALVGLVTSMRYSTRDTGYAVGTSSSKLYIVGQYVSGQSLKIIQQYDTPGPVYSIDFQGQNSFFACYGQQIAFTNQSLLAPPVVFYPEAVDASLALTLRVIGPYLAYGGQSNRIGVGQIQSNGNLRDASSMQTPGYAIQISYFSGGQYVLIMNYASGIRVATMYRVAPGTNPPIDTLDTANNPDFAYEPGVTPDGKTLVVRSTNAWNLFGLSSGGVTSYITTVAIKNAPTDPAPGIINALCISNDGTFAATTDSVVGLQGMDLAQVQNPQKSFTISTPGTGLVCPARYVFQATATGVNRYDRNNITAPPSVIMPGIATWGMAMNGDLLVVTDTANGKARVFNASSALPLPAQIESYDLGGAQLFNSAITPDGRYIAVTASTAGVIFIDRTSGKIVRFNLQGLDAFDIKYRPTKTSDEIVFVITDIGNGRTIMVDASALPNGGSPSLYGQPLQTGGTPAKLAVTEDVIFLAAGTDGVIPITDINAHSDPQLLCSFPSAYAGETATVAWPNLPITGASVPSNQWSFKTSAPKNLQFNKPSFTGSDVGSSAVLYTVDPTATSTRKPSFGIQIGEVDSDLPSVPPKPLICTIEVESQPPVLKPPLAPYPIAQSSKNNVVNPTNFVQLQTAGGVNRATGTIKVINTSHCWFEFANKPGVPIPIPAGKQYPEFTVEQYANDEIRWIHDGSIDAPSVTLEGCIGVACSAQLTISGSAITFTPTASPPQVTKASLAVTQGKLPATVTGANFDGIDPTAVDPGNSDLAFSFTSTGGSFNPATGRLADLKSGAVPETFTPDGRNIPPTGQFCLKKEYGPAFNKTSESDCGEIEFSFTRQPQPSSFTGSPTVTCTVGAQPQPVIPANAPYATDGTNDAAYPGSTLICFDAKGASFATPNQIDRLNTMCITGNQLSAGSASLSCSDKNAAVNVTLWEPVYAANGTVIAWLKTGPTAALMLINDPSVPLTESDSSVSEQIKSALKSPAFLTVTIFGCVLVSGRTLAVWWGQKQKRKELNAMLSEDLNLSSELTGARSLIKLAIQVFFNQNYKVEGRDTCNLKKEKTLGYMDGLIALFLNLQNEIKAKLKEINVFFNINNPSVIFEKIQDAKDFSRKTIAEKLLLFIDAANIPADEKFEKLNAVPQFGNFFGQLGNDLNAEQKLTALRNIVMQYHLFKQGFNDADLESGQESYAKFKAKLNWAGFKIPSEDKNYKILYNEMVADLFIKVFGAIDQQFKFDPRQPIEDSTCNSISSFCVSAFCSCGCCSRCNTAREIKHDALKQSAVSKAVAEAAVDRIVDENHGKAQLAMLAAKPMVVADGKAATTEPFANMVLAALMDKGVLYPDDLQQVIEHAPTASAEAAPLLTIDTTGGSNTPLPSATGSSGGSSPSADVKASPASGSALELVVLGGGVARSAVTPSQTPRAGSGGGRTYSTSSTRRGAVIGDTHKRGASSALDDILPPASGVAATATTGNNKPVAQSSCGIM